MSINHNFFKRKESRSGSNRGPSAYQPSALPLGHIGSQLWFRGFLINIQYCFILQLMHRWISISVRLWLRVNTASCHSPPVIFLFLLLEHDSNHNAVVLYWQVRLDQGSVWFRHLNLLRPRLWFHSIFKFQNLYTSHWFSTKDALFQTKLKFWGYFPFKELAFSKHVLPKTVS